MRTIEERQRNLEGNMLQLENIVSALVIIKFIELQRNMPMGNAEVENLEFEMHNFVKTIKEIMVVIDVTEEQKQHMRRNRARDPKATGPSNLSRGNPIARQTDREVWVGAGIQSIVDELLSPQ